MRDDLPSRSTVAAVLVLPLLAIAVLSGLGAVANHQAGGRAERVRELVPFAAALTTLVHELQQERGLSDDHLGSRAGRSGPGPEALPAVREAVDGALAAYRTAAVRLGVSDRDRRLHQRLDDGLAQLAGLEALRSSVDRAAPQGTVAPTPVFRRYTGIIGGLLGVDSEIGLHEAGRDAELLRAVTARSSFSRAKELADRERGIADRAASRGRLDPSEVTRLAVTSGRREGLLDQFQAFAGAGQRELYARATNRVEAEQGDRLRRAALEGGSGPRSGPDLAAWSSASAARVERMRVVELGLTGEVARLADRAARAADRRALAYGAALVPAACFAAVLWLLAPRPGRRTTGSPDQRATPPAAPVGGSGRPGPALVAVGGLAAPPPVPPAAVRAGPEPAQGVLDLARRGQELVDQQLELLADRDHADPRLPGRLLQVDRLAGRARRNAYNLVVLAGGEPIRRRDRPAAMAEVVAAAVRDNRDGPRVDVVVADDLLVPQRAADDLANLLGELVDNATAFSAPETRVRVSGQRIGSGYVLEVEDRGLGMTDEELDGVNRRLAGQPVTDADLEQRLGTWVAGRLADRHDVKVQLRRSAAGGVTAFVFLPQHLVIAPTGKDEAQGAAVARLQSRRYPTRPSEDADGSLSTRAPNTSLAPDLAASQAQGVPGWPESRPSARSPEEVRSMLSRYRSGIERGRAAARDLPEDPEGAGRRPGQAPDPGF